MRKISFLTALLFLAGTLPLRAGAADLVDKEAMSLTNPGNSDDSAPKPSAFDDPDYDHVQPDFKTEGENGSVISTYKNPDGSYTEIERDRDHNVLSKKRYGSFLGKEAQSIESLHAANPAGKQTKQ